jgi:hypothetical protein
VGEYAGETYAISVDAYFAGRQIDMAYVSPNRCPLTTNVLQIEQRTTNNQQLLNLIGGANKSGGKATAAGKSASAP